MSLSAKLLQTQTRILRPKAIQEHIAVSREPNLWLTVPGWDATGGELLAPNLNAVQPTTAQRRAPQSTEGKRAARTVGPNAAMLSDCNQYSRGGLSKRTSALNCGVMKSPVASICLDASTNSGSVSSTSPQLHASPHTRVRTSKTLMRIVAAVLLFETPAWSSRPSSPTRLGCSAYSGVGSPCRCPRSLLELRATMRSDEPTPSTRRRVFRRPLRGLQGLQVRLELHRRLGDSASFATRSSS
mmetsp:Transcript_5725/g.20839  ORF Transcript_5725/g.20839 Transcript_5725/m.20839 type:complete len:242 (-) Transcript_5725:100-825(-)|eukprot:scaffold4120_cov400-Prasinococcus_capsulatus_cf.AAC.8